MANAKCSNCRGSGRVPSHLNPYGFKLTAGMGMDVCPRCGGSGKDPCIQEPTDAEPSGGGASTPTVVWIFGFIGAFVFLALKGDDTKWYNAVVFGFIIVGMAAGFLSTTHIGRIILLITGLGFAALMVAAILMAANA